MLDWLRIANGKNCMGQSSVSIVGWCILQPMSIQNIANRLYPKTIYLNRMCPKTTKTTEAQETVRNRILLVEKKDNSVGLENWRYWNCTYGQRIEYDTWTDIYVLFMKHIREYTNKPCSKTIFNFLLLRLQSSTICFRYLYMSLNEVRCTYMKKEMASAYGCFVVYVGDRTMESLETLCCSW